MLRFNWRPGIGINFDEVDCVRFEAETSMLLLLCLALLKFDFSSLLNFSNEEIFREMQKFSFKMRSEI